MALQVCTSFNIDHIYSLSKILAVMDRLALKEFVFSDGTRIPKGAIVTAATSAIHFNEGLYPDAHTFDPFRFSKIREEEGKETSNQFAAASSEWVVFGIGKHAW